MSKNGTATPAPAGAEPLATKAMHRILAWPRYERPTDLETLTRSFGPAFARREDVCLCLRHDPTIDIPLADAVAAISAELTSTFGDDIRCEVLIVDDPMDEDGWAALGRAVTGVILLPWSWDPYRHTRLKALGHPLMGSGDDLQRHLAGERITAAAPTGDAPAVSVIMPTFDRPEFLRRALDSLAAQTFRDFEVVVVNDGGAAVEAVLASYTSRLAITYVRHGVNRHVGAARNTGLAIARGTYVAYLDDDDQFQPDHLQALVEAARRGGHPVAYSDATWMLEQKTPGGYQAVRPILTRSKPFDREQLLVTNYIPLVSVLHERACVDKIGGFDEELRAHEDWDLLIRLAAGFDFAHVARATAQISWREDGSTAGATAEAESQRATAAIHARYGALAEGKPQIIAAQERVAGPAPGRIPAQVPGQPLAQRSTAAPPAPAPNRAEPIVRQARALIERGDLDGACALLLAQLDLALESADIVLTLADIFVAQGKVQAAGDILEQASLLHPNNVDISVRLAQRLVGTAAAITNTTFGTAAVGGVR